LDASHDSQPVTFSITINQTMSNCARSRRENSVAYGNRPRPTTYISRAIGKAQRRIRMMTLASISTWSAPLVVRESERA